MTEIQLSKSRKKPGVLLCQTTFKAFSVEDNLFPFTRIFDCSAVASSESSFIFFSVSVHLVILKHDYSLSSNKHIKDDDLYRTEQTS